MYTRMLSPEWHYVSDLLRLGADLFLLAYRIRVISHRTAPRVPYKWLDS